MSSFIARGGEIVLLKQQAHRIPAGAVAKCMRLSVEYVNDAEGNVRAVQVPVAQWQQMLKTLRAAEQKERIRKDLAEALNEVELKRKQKQKSKAFDEFLREL